MLGGDGWRTGGEVEFFSNPKYVVFKGKLEKESIGWLTFFEINAFLFGQNQKAQV